MISLPFTFVTISMVGAKDYRKVFNKFLNYGRLCCWYIYTLLLHQGGEFQIQLCIFVAKVGMEDCIYAIKQVSCMVIAT